MCEPPRFVNHEAWGGHLIWVSLCHGIPAATLGRNTNWRNGGDISVTCFVRALQRRNRSPIIPGAEGGTPVLGMFNLRSGQAEGSGWGNTAWGITQPHSHSVRTALLCRGSAAHVTES